MLRNRKWLSFYLVVLFCVLVFVKHKIGIIRIDGNSMYPTLVNKELCLVYRDSNIRVNDIVVFEYFGEILVKRVKIIKDKTLWVEGDNQNNSVDSRNFGFINASTVIGKIL